MGKNKLNLETNRHFTVIIDDIIYDKKLTAYEKLLYVILKTYTNKNTNTIFPSHKLLAENMNVSIFTVKKAIEGLIEKGYLKKKSGKNGIKGIKDTSNTYILIEKIEEKKELSHATTPDAQKSPYQYKIDNIDNKTAEEESQEEKLQCADSENIENEDIKESQEEKRAEQEEKKTEQTEPDGQGIESHKWRSDSDSNSKEVLEAYETLIKKNIEYENLCNAHQYDVKFIDEIVSNILDVVMSNNKTTKTIKIAREQKNIELVKSVLLKLNYYQIEHVIQKYHQITTRITNKRQYILTMLYNAHLEAESDVINEVAHDLSALPLQTRDRKKEIKNLENYLL